ncbi:MAG: hypothetical protein NWE83_05685 [Candidatus Bathyarchaeota archaeon]|nr:hypothetical protein [Candidatus Bathyarchaeota archaeon]
MDKRTYNLVAGIIMIIVSLVFFMLPSVLNLDAFIPIMFALVSFVIGIWFFITGWSEK